MAEVSTPLPPSYSAPRSYPSLSDVSSALPTFVLAELIFFAVAVLALAHAWTRPDAHPNGRQRHVAVVRIRLHRRGLPAITRSTVSSIVRVYL